MSSDSVATAAATGDRYKALVALRDKLAESIDEAEPQYRAALARQLTDVLDQLAGITPPKVSARDEIAAKRAARRAAPVGDSTGSASNSGAGSSRAGRKRGAGS